MHCSRCGKPAAQLHYLEEDLLKGGWIQVGPPPASVPGYCEDCRVMLEAEHLRAVLEGRN